MQQLVSKSKWSQRIAEAVVLDRYLPWKALDERYPHLTHFLRRITRDEEPFFETADDILHFIRLKSNSFVFQPLEPNTPSSQEI